MYMFQLQKILLLKNDANTEDVDHTEATQAAFKIRGPFKDCGTEINDTLINIAIPKI